MERQLSSASLRACSRVDSRAEEPLRHYSKCIAALQPRYAQQCRLRCHNPGLGQLSGGESTAFFPRMIHKSTVSMKGSERSKRTKSSLLMANSVAFAPLLYLIPKVLTALFTGSIRRNQWMEQSQFEQADSVSASRLLKAWRQMRYGCYFSTKLSLTRRGMSGVTHSDHSLAWKSPAKKWLE